MIARWLTAALEHGPAGRGAFDHAGGRSRVTDHLRRLRRGRPGPLHRVRRALLRRLFRRHRRRGSRGRVPLVRAGTGKTKTLATRVAALIRGGATQSPSRKVFGHCSIGFGASPG